MREQRDDRLAGVTTDDRDDGLAWVTLAGDALHEGLGTHDIEGSDTEELLWVELAGLLEDLGGDRDGRVDWVGDDEDVGVRAGGGNALDEALDDAGVDLEEVVAGHAWLAYVFTTSAAGFSGGVMGWLTRDASRDDNDVGISEGLLHAIIGGEVALNLSNGGDVGEIGGNAWCVDDIVEGEFVDERAGLEEEGQWLYSGGFSCCSV